MMYKPRPPELDQYKMIWLTQESYEILREQKKLTKKSMAKILDELIKNIKHD